ncbi:hypothetical protein B0H14DRAFT_2648612 [Mycena olivaceomarginata]|nr:hypothetical protein B0H14DRAFT_2648612 [Mycena olivaceomarginata]
MASPTPGPSGTPQDQDLGPAQFTYPPVAQNPHQRYPPVPTRTEAVSHPLGSDERRRPADFDSGIRTKAVVVSGPERDQHDQAIAEIREHTERERKQRLEAEASNRRLMDSNRQLLDQMGQMQQQSAADDAAAAADAAATDKHTILAERAAERAPTRNAEKRDSRTGGSNSSARRGRAPSPQPSFPTTEPQMIPRFMGSQPRAARKGSYQASEGHQGQQSRMTKEEDLWWKTQTMVRQVWRNKYSTDTAAEFASYVPAAERLVQLCNDGIAGPPEDVFILDFSKGYQTSLWNDAIIQKFTMALQAAHRESSDQWGVSEASDLYVSGEFYNQLKQSREAWAKQPLRWKLRRRLKAELKRRSNDDGPKKFTRRKSCVQLTLKLKDDQEVDVGTWQYLQDLLERLGKDGMSSEEEGVHDLGTTVVSVYYVKLCVWRAKPITDYMLLIDRSAAEVKTSKGGSSGPRIRANTNPIGTTAAPPGLPRKMYDEQWLAEREKNAPYWVSTTLRVSEEAFQFLVSTMEEDEDL